MSAFPITGRFVGDFVPHLVAVDTDDTMDQVAAKVASNSVGHRVARPKGTVAYDVLMDDQVIAPGTTLGEVMAKNTVLPLKWFDVRFRETGDA